MTDTAGSAAAALTGNPQGQSGAQQQQQQQSAPWYEDGFKELVGAKGWKSPNDVLQSYRGLEHLLGADKAGRAVVLPKDDTDVETANTLYTRLGRPEKPDGYKLPESLKDDPLAAQFRERAHKAGMTSKQFDDVIGWFSQSMTAEREKQDAEFRAKVDGDVDKLKTEWGAAYDTKVEHGRRAARQFGADADTITALEEKMGTAWVFKFFAGIGEKLGEDTGVPGGSAGASSYALTPDQAAAKIGELWSTKAAALRDANHPDHKSAHDELERLYKIKSGSSAAAVATSTAKDIRR